MVIEDLNQFQASELWNYVVNVVFALNERRAEIVTI